MAGYQRFGRGYRNDEEGDKAAIILPSGLAWGSKGSSTGIIPPFTSVIYEIDLVSVQQRANRL